MSEGERSKGERHKGSEKRNFKMRGIGISLDTTQRHAKTIKICRNKPIQQQAETQSPTQNGKTVQKRGIKSSTYVASQVRAFTITVVDATLRGVPVVAVIVTGALAVELAVAVGDVSLGGL